MVTEVYEATSRGTPIENGGIHACSFRRSVAPETVSCLADTVAELAKRSPFLAQLLPAAAAWELNNELPRFSIALHGAAELLGAMLLEGVERSDIDAALERLLDDIEVRIAPRIR